MNKILLFLLVCGYTIFVSGKTEKTSLLKQEKIYIHTDKPFYLMGDTIWIKGYLVDAQTHKEQDVQSRFIHVELINDKNKVLLRKKLMAEVVIQGVSPLAGYSYKSVNKTFIEQQKAGNALELLNQMPEVCIYRVMKKRNRDGVPVPTGEQHVGLLKRDFFIEDYLRTDADLVPRKTGGSSNPKNPTREQKVGDLSTNPLLKPAQQAGLTQDGRQCARVSVFVDGVKSTSCASCCTFRICRTGRVLLSKIPDE